MSWFRCWDCKEKIDYSDAWTMYWGGNVCGDCYHTEMSRLKKLVEDGWISKEEFMEKVINGPHAIRMEIKDEMGETS